jgi:uncharacterized protein YraI
MLLLGLLSMAVSSTGVQAADATWRARYWNNRTLSGTPALEQQEAQINHNWGHHSPAPGVNKDDFSVRWTRTVNFPSGIYRFTARMDDGMRVWIDDVLIIDDWNADWPRTRTVDYGLSAGEHRVKVEYFEAILSAEASFRWDRIGDYTAPTPTITNWRGEYYNNRTLSGAPALVRDDAAINFNWGDGSPAAVISADNFSARWTRSVNLDGGRYRFTVLADDGVRLWVNGALLIDQWKDQTATSYSAEINLPAGNASLKMEYYDHGGGAAAVLSWTQVTSAPIYNWKGEYYNNASLLGGPMLVRDDAAIDFNWSDGIPVSGLQKDNFSVRWTRNLTFEPGRYRFTVRVDDGARLWVNNQLLIDRWTPSTVQSYSGEIELYGGPVPVRLEYFEHTGFAEVHLSWQRLTTPPTGTGGLGTATVTSYYLNFRSGPGMNHAIITTLPRSTALNLLGFRTADSRWLRVAQANGTQGWVHAGYVQTSVPVSSLAVWTGDGGQPQPGNVTATVTAAHLNFRSGPGVGHQVLRVLSRGQSMTLTHRDAAATWVRVLLPGGAQGWVHAGYIQSTAAVSTLPVWNG